MKLTVRNRTSYRFDQPVFLEPHVIRLRPRLDASLWPAAVTLDIQPAPAVRSDHLDIEGNAVTQAWFEGRTDHLIIESDASVVTLAANPFLFLLDHPERTLPDPYPESLGQRLGAYLRAPDPVAGTVRELARDVAGGVGGRPERFGAALADRIHRECRLEVRAEGAPYAPDFTLAEGRGACRDLAVLFNECCRSVGLAARFVSGYAHIDESDDHELHAWSEIYFAGGGWRGFDPTHGLAVADRHVAVAAAARPEDAAPVSGTYRGSALATLETRVDVALTPPT